MTRTRQEIFDLAWNGLKAQGFSKSFEKGACMYRGPEGRRCAIGHCIPETRYVKSLEGRMVIYCGEPNGEVLSAAGIDATDSGFAFDLQFIHDDARGSAQMEAALRDFASTHSLTIPPAS